MSRTSRSQVDEAASKEVYDAAVNLVVQIATYYAGGRTLNEIIVAPLAIMSRIIRTHDAILLLLEKEHYQEAAVLTLTQLESGVDEVPPEPVGLSDLLGEVIVDADFEARGR